MLVTGASGFLGGEIALELDRSGYRVTALVRPGSDPSRLAGREITVIEGDIRNADDVARAMEGQTYVCHAAALVPGSGASDDEYQAVNVGGTRTVCERAIAAGVSRLLYLSTTHVFGIHPGLRVDETATPAGPPNAGYDDSKVAAEEIVMEYAGGELDSVVINPTTVYGPGSRHSGRLITLFLRGRLPVIPMPNRTLSLVFSGDVAVGARKALEVGARGERHILAGPSTTVREFVHTLARVSGKRAPRISLPGWMVASGVSAAWAASPITRWKPPVTVAGVRRGGIIYDGGKAATELGLEYTSIAAGLEATVKAMNAYS